MDIPLERPFFNYVIDRSGPDLGGFMVSEVGFADVELIRSRGKALFGSVVFDVVEILEEDMNSIQEVRILAEIK